MSDKQLQFHTWVKDSNQAETGLIGIRIRCIRSGHDHTLTVVEKLLPEYGVPDFQYASAEVSDLPSEGSSANPDAADAPKLPKSSPGSQSINQGILPGRKT